MDSLDRNSRSRFRDLNETLKRAKRCLPEPEYQEVYHSYHAVIKNTLLFLAVVCLPVILICLYILFGSLSAGEELIDGSVECITARMDYDGNFYWTRDSKVYKYPLSDYGMSTAEYAVGDRVRVYLDQIGQIVAVTSTPEHKAGTVTGAAACIGSILFPVLLILLVHCPIARKTYGKAWYEFNRQYR